MAARLLHEGHVIVYPTETLYGLGADAKSEEAVAKVALVKRAKIGRRGYILLARDLAMAQEYAEFSKDALALAQEHWPGALTLRLALRKGSGLEHCSREEGTVALRVSPHPFVGEIFKKFDRPIVSTSANVSGMMPFPSAQDAAEFFSTQEDRPEAIFCAGKIRNSLPSTIVDCTGEKLTVLREGLVEI